MSFVTPLSAAIAVFVWGRLSSTCVDLSSSLTVHEPVRKALYALSTKQSHDKCIEDLSTATSLIQIKRGAARILELAAAHRQTILALLLTLEVVTTLEHSAKLRQDTEPTVRRYHVLGTCRIGESVTSIEPVLPLCFWLYHSLLRHPPCATPQRVYILKL